MQTNLPTRPAEREDDILKFILSYTKHIDQYSDEDIELLLSCVKWQFLDIFDNKEYAMQEFASLLDNGKRREQVAKRLEQVKHSPWFLQSLSESEQLNRATYSTRAYSCAELVWSTPAMGDASHSRGWIRNSTYGVEGFKTVADAHEHISRIDLISRWWACGVAGRNIYVLGGLKIHVTSPGNPVVCHHYGITEEEGNGIHTIQLDDGEHITAVHGRSGLLVDQLLFETSNTKRHGPFLGVGGHKRDLMANIATFREEGRLSCSTLSAIGESVAQAPHSRIHLDTILVGVSGVTMCMQDDDAISNLQFAFRLMTPDSAFLIDSERKCEREIPSQEAYCS